MGPLWIDQPDARLRIARADVPTNVKEVARDLVVDGLAVIRGAHSRALCEEVIREYGEYATANRDYVDANRDTAGHEARLINFHHVSPAAGRIGTNERIMQTLDFVFGSRACVYTSLTFKYGSQQPVHRDSPHFATWPRSYFAGVWTALEDVNSDNGPLFYYKAAHRFRVDEQAIFQQARAQLAAAPKQEQLRHALDIYNGAIIGGVEDFGPSLSVDLKAGDTVIWHPETPHGGMPVLNPDATRWSIVFHCAPAEIQVHQHETFFGHEGEAAPPDRYGYRSANGRDIALAGDTTYG